MWITWSQPRTRCSQQHPKRHCVAGPTASSICTVNRPRGRSVVHSSRSRLRPDLLHPPSRPHRWASLDGGRPALLYEGVCAAQKIAVPLKQRNGVANSAGGRRGWPRSIEHTHTHACWLQREQKKKVKIMPHPDGPSRQGPPSFCWMCGFWSCAAGTALYPDSGMRPGSPGQAD